MDINLIAFIICVFVVILTLVIAIPLGAKRHSLPPRYEYSLRAMQMAITAIDEQISACFEGMKYTSSNSVLDSYMKQRQILVTRLADLTVKMQEISDRAARLPEGDEKVPVEDPYFDVSP